MKRWLSLLLVVCLLMSAMPAALMEAESAESVESEALSAPVEAEVGEQMVELGDSESDEAAGPDAVNQDGVPIDAANFPDAAFRNYVLKYCDADKDGILSDDETHVGHMDLYGMGITSLKGLEHFKGLNGLNCTENKLTGTLDMTPFVYMSNLYCGGNQLTAVNVKGLTHLYEFVCSANLLTALDVSDCSKLHSLACVGNRLTSLSIGNCPGLVSAYQGKRYPDSYGKGRNMIEYVSADNHNTLAVDKNVQIDTGGAPAPGPEPQQDDSEFIQGAISLTANIRKKVYFNESFQINAIGTVMKYKSSKPKVASVSDTGRVTALEKAGTAKITVTTILSGKKKNIVLTLDVLDPQTPTGISLRHANPITLGKGGSIQLLTDISAKKTPAKTKLKWKSSKSSVASVDKNGQVTGKKEGEATITVTTDNKLSASIVIQVSAEQQFSGSALDQCFTQNTDVENLQLRQTSILLSNKVYCLDDNPAEIEAIMGDMGFHDFVEHAHTGSEPHGLGYLLAHKDIDLGGGSSRRVFAIVCRGTVLQANEWLSNLTFGEGLNHEGFDVPAQRVYGVFSNYLDKYRVSDFRVWITGHSRGAAVANLLAGQYMNQLGISSKQVYCYTFACPNVKRGSVAAMNNIFNYNIGGDLVTRVPFEQWGYHRYGRTDPLKNSSKVYGIKVISNNVMDNVAKNVGSLSSDAVMKAAREEFQAIGAPNVGTYSLALMDALLKVANTDIAMGIVSGNPLKMLKALKKAIESAIFIKDATKLVYVVNTHSSDTYKLWMTKIEKKKLYK